MTGDSPDSTYQTVVDRELELRPLCNLGVTDMTVKKDIQILHKSGTTRLSLDDREINPDTERSTNDCMIGGHAWERSGSMSDIGTLGRYALLRSALEYNFTHVRKETLVSGSMDIPMYTISTSVSGSGSASGGITTMMTGGAGSETGSHCGNRLRSTLNRCNELLS